MAKLSSTSTLMHISKIKKIDATVWGKAPVLLNLHSSGCSPVPGSPTLTHSKSLGEYCLGFEFAVTGVNVLAAV